MKKRVLYLAALLVAACVLPASAQKFSGVIYMDYFHNVARDTAFTNGTLPNSIVNGKKDLYGFQIRRIYFTADYDLSPKVTSRLRLEADGAALSTNSKISTYFKDAYVKVLDVFKGSDVIIGIQPTLGYLVSEAAYGYRSVDKTIMDVRSIIPSRDFGACIKGKIDDEGIVNYGLQYGNAADANESDKYKRVSGLVHVKPVKNLQFSAYAEQKWQAADKNIMNIALFGGYTEKDKFNVGVEYMMSTTKDGNGIDKNLGKTGLSVFGNVNITPELIALARFDMYDPNTDSDLGKGNARNYIIVGADWQVDKRFSVIPNVQVETYEEIPNVRKIDASITARVTFEVRL